MPTGQADTHAATFAAILSARAAALAEAAAEVTDSIAPEQAELERRYGSSPLAEQMSDAVRSRLEGVVGDCRDIVATLEQFQALAGPVDLPDPEAAQPASKLSGGVSSGAQVSEGVRLLATQMSVAGSSLDEIAARLREDFGVEDANGVVRQLFGYSEREDYRG